MELDDKVTWKGRRGSVIAVSEKQGLAEVEFYDGQEVDPTEPMFPIYRKVLPIEELTPTLPAAGGQS